MMNKANKINRIRRIERREFLRGAAKAMGAVAAPWVVPASALGRQAGKAAPSERVGVAVIGLGTIAGCVGFTSRADAMRGVNLNVTTGRMNWGHLPTLGKDPNAQIVALCDVNGKRLEIAETFCPLRTRRSISIGICGLARPPGVPIIRCWPTHVGADTRTSEEVF